MPSHLSSSMQSMSSSTRADSSPPRTATVVSYRHICSTCGRAFQRATGLERHRRSAHSKEKNYACEFCSQAYARIDLLQRHVSLYHKRVAADKSRMQEVDHVARAQQPAMQQQQHSGLSTPTHPSQPLPLPQFHHSNTGVDNLMSPRSVAQQQPQQQQQQQPPLVNYGMDQDLLNWFNGAALGPLEILPDEPVMQDAAHGNGVSTASCSPPWTSPNFSAPRPMYFAGSGSGGGSSGPNSAPGSIITPLSVNQGIEALPSSTFGDALTDPTSIFLSLAQSTSASIASTDLSSISDSDMWPLPQASHFDVYQHHFAHHLPFIHIPSLRYAKTIDELEGDLRRAMAMVGGNYELLSTSRRQSGSGSLDPGPMMKPCDYYGCASLKAKTLRCIESMPDQPLGGSNSSVQVLLRRTQIMILLQIIAMFSEVKTHRVSAKLSHGALVAMARELLQHVSFGEHDGSWAVWIRREEIVRTLWSVYLVDSLQSLCCQRGPGLSLSELSRLPDLGPDELWLAETEAEFNERAAQSTTTRVSIFEFMLSLKDAAPPVPSACLSLAGQLLVVVTLVTEIMSTVQADMMTRRQLASRLERIMSVPQSDRGDALRTLAQVVDRGDAHLRQQITSDTRHLMRWLSLLQQYTCRFNLQNKAPTPFIHDFMPWYWAGMHLLGVLRGRLTFGGADQDRLQERLASYSTESQGNVDGPNDGSIEIMHLLVRIRLSLGVLDGGAKMQSAIGSPQFSAALPGLPDYLATVSLAGFFPPL